MALELDYGTLRNAKSEIESYADAYERAYTELYSLTETLMKTYSTDDSKAFNTKLEGYRDQFVQMKQLLVDYATELETIASSFEGVEKQLQEEASGIRY